MKKYKDRYVEDDLIAEQSLKMETYKINKKLLKKVKEQKHLCLCERLKICPCDEFLEKDICKCGVFEKWN